MPPKLIISVFIALLCFVQAATAHDSFSYKTLNLEGNFTQGGMIIGHISGAQSISVLSRELYLSPTGNFVFGVGRDTPAQLTLTVLWNSGKEEGITLPIEQRDYQIQRIDGVDDKFVKALPPALQKRTRTEAAQVWQARQTQRETTEFLSGFSWPAQGPITGVYGSQRVFNGVPKRPHYGLDIAGPVGTAVLAPAAGEVSLVHRDMYYSGGTLIIDHGQGISSTFIHLSEIHVKKGQQVEAGELVAEIGATGRATGPHLDWRINWFNQRLDPALLLPKQP